MKIKYFFSISLLAGVILFDLLFWKENAGLNFFIFSGFIAGVLLVLYPEKSGACPVKISLFASLLTAAMVVINNSALSMVVHVFSMLTFTGFVHHEKLRFAGSALASNFLRCLELPMWIFEKLFSLSGKVRGGHALIRFLKLAIAPALVIFLFFQIYMSANSKFAELSGNFFSFFNLFEINWLNWISFGHLMFIVFGLLLTAWALLPARLNLFEVWESNQPDTLERKRRSLPRWLPGRRSMIGLKNELRSALILIGSLNGLLFLVNLVDVRYVWFGSRDLSPALLSQYVHEGTWLLIFSILLAMGILFFFFRGNLNFFKENLWLKRLSFIWIAQNALLAFSVAARNYQYVDHYGLAYKRIGVGVFLLITLIGLITMVLKVNERKSIFYLLRLNGWAVYLIMVLSCLVNWDVLITRYNLTAETKAAIDTNFLINDVSDKNLFLLDQYYEKLIKANPDVFERYMTKGNALKEVMNQ